MYRFVRWLLSWVQCREVKQEIYSDEDSIKFLSKQLTGNVSQTINEVLRLQAARARGLRLRAGKGIATAEPNYNWLTDQSHLNQPTKLCDFERHKIERLLQLLTPQEIGHVIEQFKLHRHSCLKRDEVMNVIHNIINETIYQKEKARPSSGERSGSAGRPFSAIRRFFQHLIHLRAAVSPEHNYCENFYTPKFEMVERAKSASEKAERTADYFTALSSVSDPDVFAFKRDRSQFLQPSDDSRLQQLSASNLEDICDSARSSVDSIASAVSVETPTKTTNPRKTDNTERDNWPATSERNVSEDGDTLSTTSQNDRKIIQAEIVIRRQKSPARQRVVTFVSGQNEPQVGNGRFERRRQSGTLSNGSDVCMVDIE